MFRSSFSRRGAAATVVVIILLLIIAGGAVWYFVLRSTPEKTVNAALMAAVEDNRGDVERLATADSRDMAAMYVSGMRRIIPPETPEGQEHPWVLDEAVIDGETARVPVTVTLPSGVEMIFGSDQMTLDHVLHYEEGVWRLDVRETASAMADSALDSIFRRFGETPGEL